MRLKFSLSTRPRPLSSLGLSVLHRDPRNARLRGYASRSAEQWNAAAADACARTYTRPYRANSDFSHHSSSGLSSLLRVLVVGTRRGSATLAAVQQPFRPGSHESSVMFVYNLTFCFRLMLLLLFLDPKATPQLWHCCFFPGKINRA